MCDKCLTTIFTLQNNLKLKVCIYVIKVSTWCYLCTQSPSVLPDGLKEEAEDEGEEKRSSVFKPAASRVGWADWMGVLCVKSGW